MSRPIGYDGVMRERAPRKGELNHKLQKIMKRCFDEAGSALAAVPMIQHELEHLAKKWNVREANVSYDVEMVPCGGGNWEVTGAYRPFVEFIKVEAWRRRPNRTLAEHKVCLCYWPERPVNLPEGEENPTMSSVVNDPWILLSVHRDTHKVLGDK